MSENHPEADVLLDLALDDVADPERDRLIAHLAICAACRREYDALRGTVEDVLPAAPRIEPGPGFDRRVLDAMGLGEKSAPAFLPRRGAQRLPRRLPRWLLVAAALIVGLGLGAAGTLLVPDPPPAVTVAGAPLLTGEGDVVGGVSRSYVDGRVVLVVSVAEGTVGVRYSCRLRLADGTAVPAGDWTLEETDATWIVDLPAEDVTGVELVTDTGRVWSSADL